MPMVRAERFFRLIFQCQTGVLLKRWCSNDSVVYYGGSRTSDDPRWDHYNLYKEKWRNVRWRDIYKYLRSSRLYFNGSRYIGNYHKHHRCLSMKLCPLLWSRKGGIGCGGKNTVIVSTDVSQKIEWDSPRYLGLRVIENKELPKEEVPK